MRCTECHSECLHSGSGTRLFSRTQLSVGVGRRCQRRVFRCLRWRTNPAAEGAGGCWRRAVVQVCQYIHRRLRGGSRADGRGRTRGHAKGRSTVPAESQRYYAHLFTLHSAQSRGVDHGGWGSPDPLKICSVNMRTNMDINDVDDLVRFRSMVRSHFARGLPLLGFSLSIYCNTF